MKSMSALTMMSGHWPYFDEILCGSMNERERLGLPEYWIDSRWGNDFPKYYEAVRRLDSKDLVNCCEDPNVVLPERIAAGQLLALIGDPRINNALNPPMRQIDGGTVEVGLETDRVDEVLHIYNGLGLDRKWIEKECPRYQLNLKPYSLGLYPVTNQEYREFLSSSKLDLIPQSWAYRRFPVERANHPVYIVTAEMADAYCEWLRNQTGKPYRLPIEAEWEYAAAGLEGLEFPWGNDFLPDHANTGELGLFCSTPVGVFVEGLSPFGLADMAGNVEEYVADNYAPYPGGVMISDHLTEIHGIYRVARGGSFARFRDLARNRRRHGHNPNSNAYAMGFRLACDLS